MKGETEVEEKNKNLGLRGNSTDSHLRRFDALFGTETRKRIHAMPLFRAYFDRFKDELYSESDETRKIEAEMKEIQLKLESSFTKEQRSLFKLYETLQENAIIEIERQLFLFGCISSMEMTRELDEIDTTTK